MRGSGLEELRAVVADAGLRARTVSGWSVGMHIHHCGLAMIGMSRALIASEPPPPPSRFSLITTLVFLTGRIPRGRGKAPDAALPQENVPQEKLVALLDESERACAAAEESDRATWFKHFAFGILDRDKTLRLIAIHNRHHLRIISDIRTARG